MNKLIVILVLAAAVGFGVYQIMSSSKGPDVEISGNEVLLATNDLDIRFSKGKPLDDTFMVFGGAQLDHPNVVAVHDVGTVEIGGGVQVFVEMQYVDGGSLEARSAIRMSSPWKVSRTELRLTQMTTLSDPISNEPLETPKPP